MWAVLMTTILSASLNNHVLFCTFLKLGNIVKISGTNLGISETFIVMELVNLFSKPSAD